MKHLWTYLLLMLVINLSASNPTIDTIFSNICKALYLPLEQRPRIEVRNTTSMGAAYSKINHTIYIEKKLIDALSVLKSQKNHALAFILGHELCHAIEKDKHDTHFIAYDKYPDATYRTEQNADIQGAFVAYLAGYNCLPVMEETINLLYSTYSLNPDLKGYPNKDERIESMTLIREQVESLIALFKTANLLLLADEYSLATVLFEKINTYYPSPEVLNNLGSAFLLEAMNLGKYNYFKYALPIEIDWNFRLKKPSLMPGQKEFEPEIIRKKEVLFKRADILYKNLLLLHPQYAPAWINLVCLKMLKGDLPGARLMLNEAIHKNTSVDHNEPFRMLNGTLYLLENKKSKAITEYNGIQSPWLKSQIKQNLNSGTSYQPFFENCPIISTPEKRNQPSPLLPVKSIKLDTINLAWNNEKFAISSFRISKEFRVVDIDEKMIKACTPVKSFSQGAQKWNNSLISILNPIENKRVFYIFQ